jgi:hypothetical protein
LLRQASAREALKLAEQAVGELKITAEELKEL